MANWFTRQRLTIRLNRIAFGVALACACLNAQAEDAPQRVNDTGYGMALYEYYQGNSFQALTRLNLANSEGGIAGHGDHPALVEGGLMLAYGMTREAQKLFENLLEASDVPEETRNQAWFYLGKVFWLENNAAASSEALSMVNGDLLEDTDDALFSEWLYLKGQLALQSDSNANLTERLTTIFDQLPEHSPWALYLHYNQAVHWLASGDVDAAVGGLSQLVSLLETDDTPSSEAMKERDALEQQARLSLGRLYLGDGDFSAAMSVLKGIPLDGFLSDQALFDYAVAASGQNQHGLALQALDTLQRRPLFTPWLQQVPYARAFTVEQMGRQQAAFQAYRQAAGHYEALDQRLAQEQADLTEASLISALSFVREDDQWAQGNASQPALGEPGMLTDSYGRVRVRPDDFSLAELLSGESFQLALRDMHELYRLEDSLDKWRRQLVSFDVMLETRGTRRQARIGETRDSLSSLNVDEWTDQQAEFRHSIEQASEAGNAEFFMTAEQRDLQAQLGRVESALAELPDDESTREQRQTYQRMRAYFDWWIADQYAVNRWAAVSQLRELDDAMTIFVDQRQLIEREMGSDALLDRFAQRVATQRAELNRVDNALQWTLEQTRQSLMLLVSDELASQRQEISGYLKASRHAQARLADQLYLDTNSVAPIPESEESGADDE